MFYSDMGRCGSILYVLQLVISCVVRGAVKYDVGNTGV